MLLLTTNAGRDKMKKDLFDDDDQTGESIEDSTTSENDLRNAVLYHTDWTVETIVTQIKKGRIDLFPEFQRREAWGHKAKSLLIESILLNFPIPAITLAERPREGGFIVVDGKQRLSAISQFLGVQDGSRYNNFPLIGLTQLTKFNNMDFSSIAQNFPRDAAAIENYPIRTNVIRGWKNDSVLFSIFHRLNSATVKLSPQELRQSLHPGPFTKYITHYCESSKALRDIFPGAEPDFRMRDVELAIRFLSLALFINSYSGDLKRQLDSTVNILNQNWEQQKSTVELCLDRMEAIYFAALQAFGREGIFRKWTGSGWESRTNRAIFDVVMFAGLSDEVLIAYREKGGDVVRAFEKASMIPAFRDAVERTTKTTEALASRIYYFCEELRHIDVDAPRIQLIDNRIVVG